MRIDEAEVSWLREGFAQPDEAPSPDDCPAAERLWSAAQGELPPAEIREVIEHLALCAPCAEEWRLALAVAEPVPIRKPTPRLRDRRGFVGLLAASLVAISIGAYVLPPGALDRGEPKVTSVDDGKTLPRSQFLLHWTALPGSLSSDVEVFFNISHVVAKGEGLSENRYLVPEDALRTFPPGSTIDWWVISNLPDGRQHYSRLFKTRVH